MSILIKDMKMPKACVYRENGHLITCPLYDIDGYCGALNTEASHEENNRHSDCPLIELPPHGRLIDADALVMSDKPVSRMMMFGGQFVYTQSEIDNAPTIIESEE